jgi:hypothetical protein
MTNILEPNPLSPSQIRDIAFRFESVLAPIADTTSPHDVDAADLAETLARLFMENERLGSEVIAAACRIPVDQAEQMAQNFFLIVDWAKSLGFAIQRTIDEHGAPATITYLIQGIGPHSARATGGHH